MYERDARFLAGLGTRSSSEQDNKPVECRWAIRITGFERRRMAALGQELEREFEDHTGPAKTTAKSTPNQQIFRRPQTPPFRASTNASGVVSHGEAAVPAPVVGRDKAIEFGSLHVHPV